MKTFALSGLAMMILMTSAPAVAQDSQASQDPKNPSTPRIVDRVGGEEDAILRRQEWFLSTRTAGAEDPAERARLRKEGVLATRQALAFQRAQRAAGLRGAENIWVPKGPSPSTFGGWSFGDVSGRVSALAADFNSGTLYLGTASGGLWKSINDGLSWESIFDTAGTMTVGAVTVDPNDPNVLWAGTGENHNGCETYFGIGLLRSGDGGQTWEVRNGSGASSISLSTFASIVVDPRDSDHLVVGGRVQGCGGSPTLGALATSNDGGLTWTTELTGLGVHEVVQDLTVMDNFWAATTEGIYKSVDNGANWILQPGLPAPNGARVELAIAPSNSNVVYALFGISGGQPLYRTVDGGANWTQMASDACDGQCFYNMVLRVHRTDPDIVYRGTVLLFRSVDGGANWSSLTNFWGSSQQVHQDTHVLLMHPTLTDKFYVGSDGGLWKSEDGGNSFVNLNGNLNITQFYDVGVWAQDPERICGGAQDNSSLVRTTDDTWDLQAVTGDGFVCAFNPNDGDIAYITSYPSVSPPGSGLVYPRLKRSTNGPLGNFSDITTGGSGVNPNERSNWVTPYTLDPTSPNTLYLGTQRIYRSDDAGSSWFPVGPSDITGGSSSVLTVDVNRNFPDYVYAGTVSGKAWRTTSGGLADFVDISSGLPGNSVNDMAPDPSDPSRVFAVVGGFNVAHFWSWTESGGWVAGGAGLPNVPANAVYALTGSDVLVGTDVGVFRSFDGGANFVPYMDGLPEGLVAMDFEFNPAQNILTVGTYGRGAWQVSVGLIAPILLFDSIELPPLEIDGDGDINVEPGETWGVRVRLRNGGGETAIGTAAQVSINTPGVTMIDTDLTFVDIDGGAVVAADQLATFIVAPSFDCGELVTIDLTNVTTVNDPVNHAGRAAATVLEVGNGFEPPVVQAPLDDDLDPTPSPDWSHESVGPGVAPCQSLSVEDDWNVTSKEAAYGQSYHAGNGPGALYSKRNHAWLYPVGKDSTDGIGVDIPADVLGATLVFDHWFQTAGNIDGGLVVIDATEDDVDDFVTLAPMGGYSPGVIFINRCNPLEGQEAFHGDSGGWRAETFDLMPYVGQKIYIAFAFGSANQSSLGEGWYVDNVRVELLVQGNAICDVTEWPGVVPEDVRFEWDGVSSIEATWSATCNDAVLQGQGYSIQVGDLGQLRAGGSYGHVPVDGDCSKASPASYSPGPGSEYYLVVPNEGGRNGSAGRDSGGALRPTDGACGIQRVDECQ